jgi:hypothetical protein
MYEKVSFRIPLLAEFALTLWRGGGGGRSGGGGGAERAGGGGGGGVPRVPGARLRTRWPAQ